MEDENLYVKRKGFIVSVNTFLCFKSREVAF